MKILFGHIVHSPGIDKWYESIAGTAGEDVEVRCFCVTLDPPAPSLSWSELDRRWKVKDKCLMGMYQKLQQAAAECDVFLLYNGANVHPEFLRCLPTFNIFCCFDDPESSHDLSAPVAASFDAVFYGNIASRFQYEHMGCKKLAWLPIFTAPNDVPVKADRDKLLSLDRDIDISLVCDKIFYREKRLEKLCGEFPQAKCYGNGWDAGKISHSELLDLYRRTKIGWNVHNSTGPINRRLFALAGFGCLPICDNKTGLGHIFELGKEVVGFDTIPEAIELTHYYLGHETERCELAVNAWERFWRDYHAGAIWDRIKVQVQEWQVGEGIETEKEIFVLPKKRLRDTLIPCLATAKNELGGVISAIRRRYFRNKNSPKVNDERFYLGEMVNVYIENSEMKGINMAKERLSSGGPFEWPNMLALNWAVTSLIRKAKKIVEIGSGTGPFAHFASVDPTRTIHCFEMDDFARGSAEKSRSHPNVKYFKDIEGNLDKPYELLVSIDVIEHVGEVRDFLAFCSKLSQRAIFTTPNREIIAGEANMGPPEYAPHVRELTAGEFYWMLKQYYREVFLYHMPDVYVPWLEPMTITTKGTPLIAECIEPFISN